jgi:hypothetical protein
MYEYYPFSPHNGITFAYVLVLLFSPVNDNFGHLRNYYYYYYYYVDRLILYFVCKFLIVFVCVSYCFCMYFCQLCN